jgi:tetratricopeptide (TPR) repeat protein
VTAPINCDFVRPDPAFEEADFRREAERRVQHPLSSKATSAYWADAAVNVMAGDPAGVVRRAWRNLRLFFHQYENSDNHNLDAQAEFSPVLALPVLWMGQLVPFAALGLLVSWGDRKRRMLACVVGVYSLSMLPFMIFARYRTTILPCLTVLAAIALLWLTQRVRRRDWLSLGYASGVLALVAVFSLSWPAWMSEAHAKSMAVTFHNMGEQYLADGKVDDAIRVFERAVVIAPDVVTASMRRLGDLYRQRKDYVRAEGYMLRVLERKPDSALGRRALVQLYSDMVQTPRYRDNAEVHAKLERARSML